MNFSQFIRILRARFKIILLVLVVTMLTALSVSLLLPKSYKSTTTILLTHKGVDAVTGLSLPTQLMPGFIATQMDVIMSTSTALMVVDRLKLDQNSNIKQQFEDAGGEGNVRHWLAALLLKNLSVDPSRESNVFGINYKGADPSFVAVMANAFAEAYQEMSIRLAVEPSQRAATYLSNQINVLRNKLEVAQRKLSGFQRKKGIVDVDNRLDIEARRLNELSSQLVAAQGEVMGATSGQDNNNPDVGGHSVVTNSLINGLKANLAQAEAELADVKQKLGANHPNYEGIRAQANKLRLELARHVSATSLNAISREAELSTALEAQKTKVLNLKQARNDLQLLFSEVEGAQHAYDSALQHLNRTSLEGHSNLSSVSILDSATEPVTHDSPNLMLNMILSVFLGTMLGVGFGLLAEMLDRRVRSTEDLVELLHVPVLGEVNWRASKRGRLRLPLIRSLN